ncbi:MULTISPECIES: sigma 54-interacting transcriptional regulator [Fusobacterium]|jgi:transcriptional regulator with PAS, ATPase and Fis domain|uniref:Sigma 54-interacting transcriptional regulator n=1 Tax=Fusobacterium hominis TaxID=2764326 RepID=A0A7G9GWG6_9FUSO|nr:MULTISPECIES: sigma 54-interacting transcriptional regulator [Fusobacterium]QNM15148.1 sigma 54-interacting transcriptional regulator [Fusobacterium hominis]
MSFLKKIQNYVKDYAEIIADILQCDVEIVDEYLVRISGTGLYEENIDEITKGTVYRHVFESKKSRIVINPKEDDLCKNCEHKENCTETLEISAPIFYKDKVIGVIGLVCFTEEDKRRLLKNMETHLRFTEKIADFISGKVFEFEEELEKKERIEIMKQIINNYDKCVLVIDNEGQILDANNLALKELKIDNSLSLAYQKINIIPKNELLFGKEIFSAEINKEKYTLIGTLLSIPGFSNNEHKIFLFENFNYDRTKETTKNKYASNNVFLEDIICISDKMKKLKEKIQKISKTQSTVLITGESGTGKELIARAIHNCSDRAKQPFIAINCGAIPENLLESELFGYIRGAFSGASNEGRVGKFELANNGVIFLDEIGEMPLYLQVKLLRVLQERTLVRIGSNKLINLNIRVIAATNKNLLKLVKEGKFREDLYYRLNVIPLKVPALRDRQEDILLLTDYLNSKYSRNFDNAKLIIDEEISDIFLKHSWPGNVRELENSIEFLLNMADENGNIDSDSREYLRKNLKSNSKYDDKVIADSFIDNDEIITLEESEKRLIAKALKIYGSDTTGKNICAEKLGIGIATLYRKIEKYKL